MAKMVSTYYQALRAPKGTPCPYPNGSKFIKSEWAKGQAYHSNDNRRMTYEQWKNWDRCSNA